MEHLGEQWERALAIVAHPDDLEYGAAARDRALDRRRASRWRTSSRRTARRGSTRCRRPNAPASARPRSARARPKSASSQVEFLDHPDGLDRVRHTRCAATSRSRSAGTARRSSSRSTTARRGAAHTYNMADHRHVGLAVIDAVRDAANRWVFAGADGLDPWPGVEMLLVNGSPVADALRRRHRHARARDRVARAPRRVPRARRSGRARVPHLVGRAARVSSAACRTRRRSRCSRPEPRSTFASSRARRRPSPDPDTPLLAGALDRAGPIGRRRRLARSLASTGPRRAVTVLRSPWDYVDHHDEFLAWARESAAVSALWNPLALVRWNTHKAYLLDLHERGAPVVPTVVLLGGSAASLDGICDAQGWNSVVVKPAVASGGKGARRADVGDAAPRPTSTFCSRAATCSCSSTCPRSTDEGEWSVVLVDGAGQPRAAQAAGRTATTACRRSGAAAPSGSSRARCSPSSRRACARCCPRPALYARIDLVSIAGQWHVMEVEVDRAEPVARTSRPTPRDRLADAIGALLDAADASVTPRTAWSV